MKARLALLAAATCLAVCQAAPVQVRKVTASTDDRESSGLLSFPPGVRMLCHADVSGGAEPLLLRWELRRGTTIVENEILSAHGTEAAFRLPSDEGQYELVVTAQSGAQADSLRLPVTVKRRSYPTVPFVGGPKTPGAALQRTMTLLATSTPDHRNPVRILFYGQSLTKQDWARSVANNLRERFPYADLTIANRSIGGYSSPFLIRTLPHDVYAYYPDLIIFHDYGDENLYEQIIAAIRSHTTAEILLQSDRASPPPASGPDSAGWHERHSLEWLPGLAQRFGLEWADLWRPWSAYLEQNHLQPADVLRDGAHYTLQGDDMVAQITNRYLVYLPGLASGSRKMVRSYEIGRDLDWRNGRLKLQFEGNRIDAIGGWGNPFHGGEAEVWIDGKRPSQFPELYSLTLPTDTFAVDWPAINRVSFAKPPIVEEWTLRVIESSEGDSRVRFEVIGSRTGPDGQGISTEPFLSKSGRVVIQPEDWAMKRAFDLKHVPTPPGFEIHWRVEAQFLDTYREERVDDPSREISHTLASGLPNGTHTLELVAKGAFPPVLRALRVYEPPYKPTK